MSSAHRQVGTVLTIGILTSASLVTTLRAADPAGSGPEPAIVYSDEALPTHTIYRPESLEDRYPVVLWGNGSCVNSNFGYREFLAEIASHGFIVAAIGPIVIRPRRARRDRQTRPSGRLSKRTIARCSMRSSGSPARTAG